MIKQIAVCVTAFAIVASSGPVDAQQSGKVWSIGYLTPAPYIWPTFLSGLRELGYVKGKNLIIEFRRRKRPKPYLDFAKELVALKPDLILAVGSAATRAAKQATTTIPIVMGNSSGDPVQFGLIDSLARPGGNVTGVTDILSVLAGKRVELLKEIFPNLSRIAHLDPGDNTVSPAHLKNTETAARALGVRVQAQKVKRTDDLESAFRAASEGGAEALIVVGVSHFISRRPRIINLAAKYRLPTMYSHTPWVRRGGLISYATDVNVRYRRAAQYVDKILKGAKPADLPVEQARNFSLEINLKTAKALGITIPPSILLRATKVIE